MKIQTSFNTKNEVEKILIMKDEKMLTNQSYYDEGGESIYILCVYSLKNALICDINLDFYEINELYQTDDGNAIIDVKNIKIIKIQKIPLKKFFNYPKIRVMLKYYQINHF